MRPVHRWSIALAIFFSVVWVGLCLRFTQQNWFEPSSGKIWGVVDDVYVTANYARTVSKGEGPLWYPGAPRVEGFTSPLWVVLFAGIHLLPGFAETRLGAYVFALNALLLAATAVSIALMLAPRVAREGGRLRRVLCLAVVLLMPLPAGALSRWAAAGFEVVLVALSSVLAFKEALRDENDLRELRVAVLAGLAFWTRMDAVLCCAPALVLVLAKLRERKRLATFVGCFVAMAGVLLLARRWYYGEWLPNTYYLKIQGWPLGRRLRVGLFQNLPTLKWVLLAGTALVVVAWRSLAPADRPVLLGLLPLLLTLAYSTQSGGDFLWPAFGYDRHVAASLPLSVFTVATVMLCARGSPGRLSLLGVLAAALTYGPVVTVGEGYTTRFSDQLPKDLAVWKRMPPDMFLEATILDGQRLEEVTRPKARIAVCAAGAAIYFSHRGGVDILGKNDTYVSHLPASERPGTDSRCFRALAPSGHNKEDVPGLFALRHPEVSIVAPPSNVSSKYVSFSYQDRLFYGIRKSSAILWKRVTDVRGL
jgi:hypothetical protein